MRKVNLATDFTEFRSIFDRQPQRNAPDGPDISSDVFAGSSIPAGRCTVKGAIDIGDADCKAIQLQLTAVLNASILVKLQKSLDTSIKFN